MHTPTREQCSPCRWRRAAGRAVAWLRSQQRMAARRPRARAACAPRRVRRAKLSVSAVLWPRARGPPRGNDKGVSGRPLCRGKRVRTGGSAAAAGGGGLAKTGARAPPPRHAEAPCWPLAALRRVRAQRRKTPAAAARLQGRPSQRPPAREPWAAARASSLHHRRCCCPSTPTWHALLHTTRPVATH